MENEVYNLLDELEEIIDRGTKIPMTGKVLVDDTVIFELIDRLRAVLPEELRNAQWVLNERNRILAEAEGEAQKTMEQGKNYAVKMAEENEVVKQAQSYRDEIIKQAHAFEREVKTGALQYADELFQAVEEKFYESVQALRRNREELRAMTSEKSTNEGE